ncbi:MAG: SDR family NAD(P)-dependent oxidoreductase [Clostridia bacterium]|nr:SDR family NAD(P)-dependent oxidoreductase [Clostridia bacterium]
MNKVVIVTGGTSGIGLAAVEALRARGCVVYALSRRGQGEGHIPCDVADEQSARAAVNQVLEKEGRIDILVNCAGFGISGAAELTPLEMAKRQLDVNLFGTANLVNAVIPAMRRQGGGRIVNTGSVAGFVPIPFQTWYSASKAAVQSYTMAMANELRPFGITLAAVLPGDTKTGFTAARNKIDDPEGLYGGRIERSVKRMEHDEQTGVPAEVVGAFIARVALKKRGKPLYIPGFSYNLVNVLIRILPSGLANRLIGLLYAK